MTLVAGFTNGKQFAIGGDSGAYEDNGAFQRSGEPKVWKAGTSLVGGAGSFRALTVAKKSGISDPYALAAHMLEVNVPGEWSLLIVTAAALYEITEDGGVLKLKEKYSAVGAANQVALGSLSVLDGKPSDVIRTTLSAASKHHNMCMPPYTVLSL